MFSNKKKNNLYKRTKRIMKGGSSIPLNSRLKPTTLPLQPRRSLSPTTTPRPHRPAPHRPAPPPPPSGLPLLLNSKRVSGLSFKSVGSSSTNSELGKPTRSKTQEISGLIRNLELQKQSIEKKQNPNSHKGVENITRMINELKSKTNNGKYTIKKQRFNNIDSALKKLQEAAKLNNTAMANQNDKSFIHYSNVNIDDMGEMLHNQAVSHYKRQNVNTQTQNLNLSNRLRNALEQRKKMLDEPNRLNFVEKLSEMKTQGLSYNITANINRLINTSEHYTPQNRSTFLAEKEQQIINNAYRKKMFNNAKKMLEKRLHKPQ